MSIAGRILMAAIYTLRPFFGFVDMVCIYEQSCVDFAQEQFNTQPLYTSIPRITLRVLSCNPITAYFRTKQP